MSDEEKAKVNDIISMSNTNQVYDIVDFNALHESLYEDLMEMAKWKEQQVIDKTCEWLKANADYYISDAGKDWISDWKLDMDELLEDFTKAMEE